MSTLNKTSWEQVRPGVPGVLRYRDSCNVYALNGPEGVVLIDAGTGHWLDHLDQLPGKPVALLCTHYFRDHSAGCVRAASQGIKVYVPFGEKQIFEEPAEHFRTLETYNIYSNIWDMFAPIESTPISGVLRDYQTIRLAGLEFEVIPLPGATPTQIGFATTLSGSGDDVIFCGEAICSHGKIARVSPLQYDYHDLKGAVNVYQCAKIMRDKQYDGLLPSLGEPMFDQIDSALAKLQVNMKAHCDNRHYGEPKQIEFLDQAPLTKVTEHVWMTNHSKATNWIIRSDSGKVMLIDYGFNDGFATPGIAKPRHRRALLHSLDALKSQFGIDRIDTVLVSHFHDDHVCGIPTLQRLFGTQCWAAENFADLLEHPQAHCFPCTWSDPIHVDRRLSLDQPFQWEEYTFYLHPMSGHTRFSSLIGFEADGQRFAHTGDQYFFLNGMDQFTDNDVMRTYVYRNGAKLDGYQISADWLRSWKPDLIITGHSPAVKTDNDFFDLLDTWSKHYQELHRQSMPLDAHQPHFDMDSYASWIWPYRIHIKKPVTVTVTVTICNPYPHEATLEVKLVGPSGWTGICKTLTAAPRAEICCELQITPNSLCRRQPFAVDLVADGQPFGQIAEALMTVGGECF